MTETYTKESIIPLLNRPITLIGMMGSGKSTLGATMASDLNLHFFDTDKFIEKETGKTIPQIFAEDGEAVFRKYEHDTIKGLLEDPEPAIIATGGGCISVPQTAEIIFQRSLCIWIDAPVDLLVKRTSRQKNRPLLKGGDPSDILDNLLKKRAPIYKRAHIYIETDDGPVEKVAERTMRQISKYLIQHKAP